MTLTRTVIAVALAGILVLAAALLARRPETVVRGNPIHRVPIPQESLPSAGAEVGPAMAVQLREAEGELLWLCEKRDQLLGRKKEMEQTSGVPPGLMKVEMSAAADEHYRQAEQYYQAGVYDRAEAECRQAIEILPDHLSARTLLKEIRLIVGKRDGTPTAPR